MSARRELAGGRLACVPEAPLEDSGAGLAPTGEGWFVVNVRDTKWAVTAEYGSGCGFESREFRFEQLGFNICALEPGEPNCLYHSESQQEAFLVLSGECRLLGGMARGRPALATLLMTVGVISLAVPGSASFAGEFLILLGVFGTGWGWAVAGATGIVLAAMYMLRLISAVLHREPGPAGHDAALDLRPAEVGIVLPLVG